MIYLYETIPACEGNKVKQYEIKQSANDAPLARHPKIGEPIQRVTLRGWGLVTRESRGGSPSQGDWGSGPSGCDQARPHLLLPWKMTSLTAFCVAH